MWETLEGEAEASDSQMQEVGWGGSRGSVSAPVFSPDFTGAIQSLESLWPNSSRAQTNIPKLGHAETGRDRQQLLETPSSVPLFRFLLFGPIGPVIIFRYRIEEDFFLWNQIWFLEHSYVFPFLVCYCSHPCQLGESWYFNHPFLWFCSHFELRSFCLFLQASLGPSFGVLLFPLRTSPEVQLKLASWPFPSTRGAAWPGSIFYDSLRIQKTTSFAPSQVLSRCLQESKNTVDFSRLLSLVELSLFLD